MATATTFEFQRDGSFIRVRPTSCNPLLSQQQRETEFLFDRDEIHRLNEIANSEGGWAKL